MSKLNLGFFGSSVRFILIIINLVFFLMGLIVFIIAAVLKWTSLFNNFVNIQGVDTLVKLGSIESVSSVLLVMGAFAVILSLLGLFGAKYGNKFLLLSYEVIIILIFLTQGISALVIGTASSALETEFRNSMNKTIDSINNNDTSTEVFDRECKLLRDVSSIFKCCGANGPSDFVNASLAEQCCFGDYDIGCTDKVVKDVVDYSTSLIVIPTILISIVEFLAIVMVPILICRISKRSGYEST